MALIWLIEDNPAFREATLLILRRHPDRFTSRAFDSCEAALNCLAQGEKPEVILLDVGLPGMDGIQGIEHFKKAVPNASLLILTVFEDDEKIFKAICSGASGYLLKSESLKDVVIAVDQAIAGGSPMNPRIAKRVLAMFSSGMIQEKKDYGLTPREQSVLECLAGGLARKQIAEQLDISTHTVGFFIRGIYKKLHVQCQTAAVSTAMRAGLIPSKSE